MAEEKKSAGAIAFEGFQSATDGILHVLEHAAEKAGQHGAEEGISGLGKLLSVKEAVVATADAVKAAQHGDWKEFGAKMGEVASVGPNIATFGIYGALQSVWDAAAAVRVAQGGDDFSWSTLQKEGFDVLTNIISDRVFELTNPDAVGDVRINPYQDEEREGVDIAHTFFDLSTVSAPAASIAADRTTIFEPMEITHPVGHHTVFEPMEITLPADQNTEFEPMEITLPADQNTVFEPMIVTMDDASAGMPSIYDQLLSSGSDFDLGGFTFGSDLGTIADGGSMSNIDAGSPDSGGGGGDQSPAGGNIVDSTPEFGGGFHDGGGGFGPGSDPSGL